MRRWLILFVVVSLVGCSSSDEPTTEPGTDPGDRTSAPNIVRVDEVPDSVAPADWNTITDRISRDLHTISPAEPVAELGLQKAWKATNQAQRLEARFGEGKLFARPAGLEAWSLELSTQAWGRSELGVLGGAEVWVDGDRLEYRRDGITEWYVNGERGIEHGFDVPRRPAGEGLLRVEVAVGGELVPRLTSTDSVMLESESGEQVLRYTGLYVEDARGEELPAHFVVEGRKIEIVVDDREAAYPIVIDPWVQQPKLLASDGAAGDLFGYAVAVSGDRVVVGARRDSDNGTSSGSVYVFQDSGSGWVETKLTASDGATSDTFGQSVAVSGDTIVIGAAFDDDNGTDSGSVYVFEYSGSGWVETKLTASDGATVDHFGRSVAVSGDTIVVGAPLDDDNGTDSGSAYVFKDSGSGWVETKLTPSDGATLDYFGHSVAVSGDTVVVGALDDDDNGTDSGSAYVFEDSGSGWVETKLTPSDGATLDRFGISVAVSGDTVVVGAPLDDDNGGDSGSVYVFEDSGTGWVEAKLTAGDGATDDRFGISVAVSGDTVVVGAIGDDDNGTDSGSAYVFEDSGSGWVETKLTASDGATSDGFGLWVAVAANTVVVGAPLDDDNGNNSGSAYIFNVPNTGPAATDYLRTNGAQVAATEDAARTIALEGTDADGEAVSFEILTDPANGTLSITTTDGPQTGTFDGVDTTTLDVAYTATSQTATTDSFTYRVADADGATDTGTVEIDITLVNDAPSIISKVPSTANEDVEYSYTAFVVDPDSSNFTFTIDAADTCGGTIDPAGTYTFTPLGPAPPTDCVLSITACDDGSPVACDTQTNTVNITGTNDAPSITSTAPTTATEDVAYTYVATATDPEGDALTFAVSSADTCGGSLTGTTYTFTPAGPAPSADCVLAIEVCDTSSECDSETATVTITAVNDAPSIISKVPSTATEDVEYSYIVFVVDADSSNFTFTIDTADTCGGAIDTSGTYTFTPAGPAPAADCILSITACDDGSPVACDTQTNTVNITGINGAPSITSTAPTTATEDTLYTYAATAIDPEGDALTFAVGTADTCGGTVTGSDYTFTPAGPTPPTDCVVGIDVCDTSSECDSETTTVTITAVNDAPSITSTAPGSATEDTLYTYVATATDPEGDTLTWAVASADTCSGTVDSSGTYTFTPAGPTPPADCVVAIEACDTSGDCDSETATVTITAVNDAPSITSTAPAQATQSRTYNYTATATDPEGDALTWATTAADTCGGTIDTAGLYTFTAPATLGDCVVGIEVCDDAATPACDTQETTVDIVANQAPVFVAPTPADMTTLTVVEADTLTFTIAATDADGDELTYSIDPTIGDSFDATTGAFEWTPAWDDAGTYALTLQATDGIDTTEREITIEVTFIDDDADGLPDTREIELDLDPTTPDSDGDGISDSDEIGDILEPTDTDSDDIIDALDDDSDDDGISDATEAGDQDLDTPPVDTDGDDTPDYIDTDSDNDTVDDADDNCVLVDNPDQLNTNDDGTGDACTDDVDGDGALDADDNCPLVANADQLDTDDDGDGDVCDTDDDGDGVGDADDACPLEAGEGDDGCPVDDTNNGTGNNDPGNNDPGDGSLSGGPDDGCGCSSANAPANGFLALLVLALVRLRRRRLVG